VRALHGYDGLLVRVGDGRGLGVADGRGVGDGVGDADGERDGLGVTVADGRAVGDPPEQPASSRAATSSAPPRAAPMGPP
jgi:hypothetical protein